MAKHEKGLIIACIIVCLTCVQANKNDDKKNKYNAPKLPCGGNLNLYVEPFVEEILANYSGNVHRYENDCKRSCKDNDRKICYYNFYLEHYQTMGVACNNCANGVIDDCFNDQCVMSDGLERGMKSINRQLPGPHIEVCKNDIIVVDVINAMPGNEAALHWHGILQAGTQYMDGVPYVTQCPIHFNNFFRYTFIADNTGTYFWHSHSGHQKADGNHGPLTIRGTHKTDPNMKLYDYDDMNILITDWQHEMATMFDPGLPTRGPGINPDTFLINGRGKYLDPVTGNRSITPYALFHFQTGKRYRLRFINSASHVCPIHVQIQDHAMTVIATDGSDVRPRKVNSFILYSGERYDFVVNASKSSGMYWLHVKGLATCVAARVYQLGIIAYNQDPTLKWMNPTVAEPSFEGYPDGKILNHPNITDPNENIIKIEDLKAYNIDKKVLSGKPPDVRIIMSFSNKDVTYDEVFNSNSWFRFENLFARVLVVGTMDGISTSYPAGPLLSQPSDESTFCQEGNLPARCTDPNFCVCPHVVKIKKGAIVEMMLVDESTMVGIVNHPMHLHGYKFYAVEMGQGLPNGTRVTSKMVREMEKNGHRFVKDAYHGPLKDTVSVPSYGYVNIRFKADNPGYWVMHCHFDVHLLTGMIMTFQVGEDSDNPPVPPNFQKCGNFF